VAKVTLFFCAKSLVILHEKPLQDIAFLGVFRYSIELGYLEIFRETEGCSKPLFSRFMEGSYEKNRSNYQT
jgi:hypothetical protein